MEHQKIAERAYSMWELAGKPDSRDQEFWLAAESELELQRFSRWRSPSRIVSLIKSRLTNARKWGAALNN